MQTNSVGREMPRGPVSPESIMLRNIMELGDQFEKHLAKELGVNRTDLEAMEHLIMAGPLSPTEIANRLEISTASVTTSVDRLTAMGHTVRGPNPKDRRSVLVSATPESTKRARSILYPMIFRVDGVLDEFSAAEREVIERYLSRVEATYHQILPADES